MKKIFFTLLMVLFISRLFAETTIYPPTLITPANHAAHVVPNVQIDWSAVAGGWSYKVQLSTDSNFTAVVQYSTNVTAYTTSELFFGTTYYWRVKAIGIGDSSAWSTRFSFTTIDTVTIVAPVDSSTNLNARLLVQWTAISGVSFYDWEVDSSLTFGSPLHRTGKANAPGVKTYAYGLDFGQKYFIRMRAGHSKDTSSWSPAKLFYTIDTVTLKKPDDNDTAKMPDVTVAWSRIGAPYYDIAFAYDFAMTNPVITSVDSSNTIYVLPDTLNFGEAPILKFHTDYYWTVRGRNLHDTSAWSYPRQLKTIKQVTLESPADNTTNVSTLPQFDWIALTGLTNYILRYDTDPGFTSPTDIVLTTDSSYTMLSQLLDHTLYYWKVQAISSTDTSVWSTPWHFTTGGGIGMNEITLGAENVAVYPNPCRGKLNIDISSKSSGTVTAIISDILGQKLFAREISVKNGRISTSISLDDLSSGIYLLQLRSEKTTYSRKIILDK